jgi:hypothetical protein
VLNSLLAEFGFPAEQLPSPFGVDGYEYWNLLNDKIGGGIVPNGRAILFDLARHRFPANEIFAAVSGLSPAVRRVCVVGAEPSDLSRVRGAREFRAVYKALVGSDVTLTQLPAATVADLGQLARISPDTVHLICHGDGTQLFFEDREGLSYGVEAADLLRVLRTVLVEVRGPLTCLVLSACRSAKAAEILRPCARVVIAHEDDLDHDDAAGFAEFFYTAVRDGSRLDAAARSAAEFVAVERHGQPWLKNGLVILGGES